MELHENPLWKKGTFSKEGFFCKSKQKPYKNHIFFCLENWLIFPVLACDGSADDRFQI